MRKYFLSFFLVVVLIPCFAQSKIRDSLFIRIDQVKSEKLSYHLKQGKLFHIVVFVKNKYEGITSFFAIKNNSDLALIKIKNVDSRKVLSYSTFNEMLNKDFLDVLFYNKVYFVLSKSREDYLVLWVQPKLPEELNKQ